ncbi:hypothetical protein BGZ90_001048 [Linnemannia elongata]|nr:hypothetical protein BGZ90_001048 [Linnemannia elongata]
MTAHQAEAQQISIWCVCDNVDCTRVLCQGALANGNFDGGSCGLDQYNKYIRFVDRCKNAKDSKHHPSQSQRVTFTSSSLKMSFKITHLIALAFAMLLVVMSTHQAEAQQIPIWCTCDSPYYSSLICNNIANGKWDGGSCGLDKYNSYIRFVDACKNSKDSKHQLHCWN